MLSPFDGLYIDTFFAHFPEGAHLSESVNMKDTFLYSVVHLFFGGESTNAKPNRRVS